MVEWFGGVGGGRGGGGGGLGWGGGGEQRDGEDIAFILKSTQIYLTNYINLEKFI